MSYKPLLIALTIVGTAIAMSHPCDAQRRKRGLLSKPDAAETETPAATAATTPAAVPQPTAGKTANGVPATTPTQSPLGQPMDLFEMASKNTADQKAANETAATEGKKNKGKDGEKEIPPPEMLTLQSDGITIMAALFKSPNADDPELAKVIVPMMLLHDWGGSMNDLGPLAQYLQSVGHTVIVPDLRGHGRSVTMANSDRPLNYKDFNRAQIATLKDDFEECKRKLMAFNNEGKLNINMLSVLAVGEMCPLATEWALTDWSYQNVGALKQGKDVQGLILVSPPKKFQKVAMTAMVKHPLLSGGGRIEIPTLVVYSQNGNSAKESSALYNLMARKRLPSTASDADVRWAQQSLFELVLPGSADGSALLQNNPQLYRFLGMFNFYKISKNADNLGWASRESKTK